MPLINLRTNLKTTSDYTSTDPNLTYGHDRKDFGSSNQPYIVTPIPEGNDNVPSSPDFLLRNGYLNPINSLKDSLRIAKFLNPIGQGTSWKGALFVLKQELLERQNVKVENGFKRIFNPLQPVLQAGVLSIGYHLNKQGLNPFDPSYFKAQDKAKGYYGVTLNSNGTGQNGGEARLSILFNAKQAISGSFTNTLLSNQQKLYIEVYGGNLTNNDVLFSYSGGPGSFLGIGKTDIRIWNPLAFKTEIYSGYAGTITYSNNTKGKKGYLVPNGATTTFSSFFQRPFNGYLPGDATNGGNTYKTSQTSFARKRGGTTKITNPNLSISPDQNFAEGDDIIDFSFELISNGDGSTSTFINLRAYIDDFSDSFNGEWDSYKYMGRAEHFYRYKGFTREMSVSFVVPVLSRADMITTYQKLNALSWLTMPDYSDAGIMRGNLAYFTMGDYLRNSIIVVKSLSYTPIMEMGFDINRKEDGTKLITTDQEYVGQLPKGMKVQCNIIPLTHETSPSIFYTPQKGEAFIGNSKHVANTISLPDSSKLMTLTK